MIASTPAEMVRAPQLAVEVLCQALAVLNNLRQEAERHARRTDVTVDRLMEMGYVHPAAATAANGRARHVTEPPTDLCLTEPGTQLALWLLFGLPAPAGGPAALGQDLGVDPVDFRPTWDRDRRQLSLLGLPVKSFKQVSENQWPVLDAFQASAWAPRIDDPVPAKPGHDPKRRLNRTIQSLNERQIHRLIRFRGDGTGTAVLWEPIWENLPAASVEDRSPQCLPPVCPDGSR
jgi:hypothetical protein